MTGPRLDRETIMQSVRDWTSHPSWKEYIESEQAYYDRAYERLDRLADWFFTGRCPSVDPAKTFAPM